MNVKDSGLCFRITCTIGNSSGNNELQRTMYLPVSTQRLEHYNYCCCQDKLLQLPIHQQLKWLRLGGTSIRFYIKLMYHLCCFAPKLERQGQLIGHNQGARQSLAKSNTVFLSGVIVPSNLLKQQFSILFLSAIYFLSIWLTFSKIPFTIHLFCSTF